MAALLAALLAMPAAAQPVLNVYNWTDYIDPGVIQVHRAFSRDGP